MRFVITILFIICFAPVANCSSQKTGESKLVYLTVNSVKVSSFDTTPDWAPMPNANALIDASMFTRWASEPGKDNEWACFDFGKPKALSKIILYWEYAYAKDYEILISADGQNWRRLALMENQTGAKNEIEFKPVGTRFVKLVGLKRANPDWGISLWEVEMFGPQELNPSEIISQRPALDWKAVLKEPALKMERPLKSPGNLTANEFQKGVVFTSWTTAELASIFSDQTLEYLAKIGVRHLAIMVVWFQDDSESANIAPDKNNVTSKDEALVHAINKAHTLGMKVMLKPHIDVRDGSWRGDIIPTPTWFESYQNFILYYAGLAQKYNVELLCLGTELASATTGGYAKNWKQIIQKIKEVYRGPLVYAANWNEYHYVPFWKELDFVGIDAYFPLTEKDEPSKDELIAAWSGYADKMQSWLNKKGLNNPVIFTEIGYSSANGTNRSPWRVFASASGVSEDQKEQAFALDAMFTVLSKKAWFKGMYWWQYFPQERFSPLGFVIRGKLAEKTLKDWYGRL